MNTNTTDSIKQVMTAIMQVQQTIPPLKREATGSTGKREYKYITLDKIWVTINQSLKDNGLVVTQSPTAGGSMGDFFQTTIYHVDSGESISQTMMMRTESSDPQKIGSAITYYRRYMLVSMLGLIVQGDDNDAADHTLATAVQKVRIIGAAKQVFPDVKDQAKLIDNIKNIVGKHPSYIRQDEAEDAVGLIMAFADKQNNRDGIDQSNE